MKYQARVAAILSFFVSLVAAQSSDAYAQTQEPVVVRTVALGIGLPYLITTAWKELGFDKKHGFDLQIEQTGNLSAQWIPLRSGNTDLVMGNFLDLLRQHKAGLKVQAFQFAYNFDDPIVTHADKPYNRLRDLKGVSLGVTRTTTLPVLLYRVAGKKAYGIDLVREAKIVEASPSLLPQMLRNGQLEATYTFRSLVFGDLAQKKLKEVANLTQVLDDAGWNTALTLYVLSDAWRDKVGPQTVRRLAAALADLNQALRTQNAGWDAYARLAKIELGDKLEWQQSLRKLLVPNYGPQNLEKMQQILDATIEIVGEGIVGVSKVDPSAFDFNSI